MPTRNKAHLRHALYYLGVIQAAEEHFKQGGEQVTAGLALFDGELPNIQAGQAWSAVNVDSSRAAARAAGEYPAAGLDCVYLRLHARDRIKWLDAALAAVRKLGPSPE